MGGYGLSDEYQDSLAEISRLEGVIQDLENQLKKRPELKPGQFVAELKKVYVFFKATLAETPCYGPVVLEEKLMHELRNTTHKSYSQSSEELLVDHTNNKVYIDTELKNPEPIYTEKNHFKYKSENLVKDAKSKLTIYELEALKEHLLGKI